VDDKTFYITTPIYYPNDKLHIGHAYTTTVADTLARYKRLRGYDVRYLTGTDEHGQKLQQRAEAAGKAPQVFVDGIVVWIQTLWKRLDISYDDFIRTTDDRHKTVVQRIFAKLLEKGDIFLGEYEGWYCTPCESFWTERQLKEGRCPDCGGIVGLISEPAYFFRVSRYADRLIEYYETHPDFIVPVSRKHEMLNNFLLPGLEDLCVSRTTFSWGIPVPGHPEHVIYVWLDALTNYITALGYMSDDPELDAQFAHYWPADVHVMAKEIVRFHAIYWPIILMALDLPLPKQIVGHGWLLMKDGKMSKSKGNVIDPNVLIDRYGSDALRYFLLREIPFGQDGVFTLEALMERLNFDLANDLGNLVHRSLAMLERFAGGVIPSPVAITQLERDFATLIGGAAVQVEDALDRFEFGSALSEIWTIVRRANRYIDETAPWALHKAGDRDRLKTVLYTIFEAIRSVSVLLQPFMPNTPLAIWSQMGLSPGQLTSWESAKNFGMLPPGLRTNRGDPIFPRLDVAAELAALDELTGGKKIQTTPAAGETGQGTTADTVDTASAKSRTDASGADRPDTEGATEPQLEQIDIAEFGRVDLRVALVVAAERIPKADKLLKLQLDVGGELRQVVSGIAKHYTPDELLGKQVILVANLKPVTLRGVESQGMILAASDGELLTLATLADAIRPGMKVK